MRFKGLAHLIMSGIVTLGLSAWAVTIWATHAGESGGQLPWPVVQGALASPLAATALRLLVAIVAAGPQILVHLRTMRGEYLVGSADVTEMSILRWSRHPAAGPPGARVERWLGHGWRARTLTLALALCGGGLALLAGLRVS